MRMSMAMAVVMLRCVTTITWTISTMVIFTISMAIMWTST